MMENLSASVSAKRKRLWYSPEDDICLLREVAGNNPFEDPHRWALIQKNVEESTGKQFSKRSLQDRIKTLTEKFEKKVEEDPFRSGIEEEITELDDLLHQILNLIREFKMKSKQTPYQIGYEKREEASDNLTVSNFIREQEVCPSSNIELVIQDPIKDNKDDRIEGSRKELNANTRGQTTPTNGGGKGTRIGSSRGRYSIKQSSLKFLEKKNDRWYEIRCRELDLEEKKFALEKKEREKRLEMEERRLLMSEKKQEADILLFQNQQRLMDIAFSIRNKNS